MIQSLAHKMNFDKGEAGTGKNQRNGHPENL
jgi:hypothetical protein